MSKKRCALNTWPIEVYDYERKVITDEAVGGIDLRRGRCNTTLKTTLFSLVSWKTHKKRKTHSIHQQKAVDGGSQPQIISSSSQSSVLSLVQDTPKIVLGSQVSQDHESLMFVRRDLHKSKQHQAQHERDVNNVINAMTSLITDQQSDLSSLQDKVHDMEDKIQELKKDLEIFRCKKNQQTNMRAPQKKRTATTSFTTHYIPESRDFGRQTQGHDNNTWYKISGKSSSNNKTMKRSTSDMNSFEKRFQLT
ncbi:unnamed protein product [Peronospora farinosa]|uniref:t-SNARE coiled-coil homology domain-containing protein n=1 Tax=Peronospora farinosa TaxID=134698 RepID=A0AAV0THG1_9STRA|nr:unnamed protein product [Peronospora farinosa]CAI5722024.1 unnamed protein product [Peronospora farinosa]